MKEANHHPQQQVSNEDKLRFLQQLLQSMDLSDLNDSDRNEMRMRIGRAGLAPAQVSAWH